MLGLEGLTDGGVADAFCDAMLAPDVLAAANINPGTRLATDYLNHFNNVVMLLEFIATMPDFVEEILAWTPVDYPGYFATSHFRHRELAIVAYQAAAPETRARFQAIVDELDGAIVAAQDLIRANDPTDGHVSAVVMDLVRGRMQPLIAEASGCINGGESTAQAEIDPHSGNAQDSIDELFG
jgi:hypothetical protein